MDISQVHVRSYNLLPTAVELFIKDNGKTYFFNLYTERSQQEIIKEFKRINPTLSVIVDGPKDFLKTTYAKMWEDGQISNFDYLMILNTYAGRSYNDINQYPIFPWVVKDFNSEQINFNANFTEVELRKTFRRLDRPIGSLSRKKRTEALDKFEGWDSHEEPSYHYESYCSNSESVTNFLSRLEPFTKLNMNLQNGKNEQFYKPFSSIIETWESCVNSKYDFRELPPEFYCLPELLKNW